MLRFALRAIILVTMLLAFVPLRVFAQAENVPAGHEVYDFLKRMEVKGVITGYHDAILPLSRKEVGSFLVTIARDSGGISSVDRDHLGDFLSEFRYDIEHSTEDFHSLIDSEEPTFGKALEASFSTREKFLFFAADSSDNVFINLLLEGDTRAIRGDTLGSESASYLQLGGRLRGTLFGRLGYYLQWTNAKFWGSRELLMLDPAISQSHALTVTNIENFDFAESYLRYDGGIVSAEIGRERTLWGNSYNEKMTLSDNVRVFDFIRADLQYKSLRYTFMHAWLMGPVNDITFTLPPDSSYTYTEPVAADKFFAGHRIEFAIPHLFDIGMQEMVIYSNRAPDLAYMNPVTLIESAQRARGERDNVFWLFDIQTHFIRNLELNATLLFDDLNFPDLFTNTWTNRYAWQAGLMYTDPLGLPNLNLYGEYTRIQPYVYSHSRSRGDTYTSELAILGPKIGPNADSWFAKLDWRPIRNLLLAGSVTLMRSGENIVDSTGRLIRNVGGDVFRPHRNGIDAETIVFLDGVRTDNLAIAMRATWECVNQIWVDAFYTYQNAKNITAGTATSNSLARLRVRMEL